MSELGMIRDRIAELERLLLRLDDEAIHGSPAVRIPALTQMTKVKAELRDLRLQETRLLDADTTATRHHELNQRAFWFQRLNTSLAIAHGAGFAAVTAHLFDPATTAATAMLSLPAMAAFALGAIVAGAIPLPLAYDNRRVAAWLMAIAAGLFVAALVLAVLGAAYKALNPLW